MKDGIANMLLQRAALFISLWCLACSGTATSGSATATSGGRGPTGQWPSGFPAYSAAAELRTDGTNSGLTSAINNAACSDGCVIEHPGNISTTITSRSGSGQIVVRPPIGERAEYTIDANIQVDNLLFAGFDGTSGGLRVTSGGENSGFAWIETSGGNGWFGVWCYGGSTTSTGLFYELVYTQFGTVGSEDDRGSLRGDGGDCNMDIRGSYFAGLALPPPGPHSDTLQNYNPGGNTYVQMHDTVFWSAGNQCFQMEGEDDAWDAYNVWVINAPYTETLWPGASIPKDLDGYFHTTAHINFYDSTYIGAANPGYRVRLQDSELYDPTQYGGTYVNGGGNTMLQSLPAAPPVPTHAQLDAIWSP